MDDLGRILRETRESRNISMEVAEEETKIRRKYLEALESGLYSDLPGEVYLKGFLRTYGNYLGLDGTSLVDQYKEGRTGRRAALRAAAAEASAPPPVETEPPQPVAERPRPEGRPRVAREVREAREARERRNQVGRPRVTRAPGSRISGRGVTMVLVAVIAFAVIAYLGWLIAGQFKAEASPATTPPASTPSDPPPSQQPVVTPPAPLPEQPKVTMAKGSGNEVLFAVPGKETTVRIEMPTGDRVWVQVWDGEKKVAEAELRAAAEYKGTNLRIQMGHMNGVSLVVNGQRFEKPMEGGPYWLTFKAQ